MATLALSLAGQAVGGLFGGPIGATIGRAIGAVAGSAIDTLLFEESAPDPERTTRLSGSSEGGTIPRAYGWNRVAGNVIWATQLERLTNQTAGAKAIGGGGDRDEDVIAANFAIALCEGEVRHLGRIWADGEVVDTEGLNIRFYTGSEDQPVDGLIAAKQGAGSTPAYRGTCYLVFEQFPLTRFGNRIPNITVEICRFPDGFETDIKAVTLIPGATEFGYDPEVRVRVASPGVTQSENAHALPNVSDWSLSLDELLSLCPNLEHVALVVAWFGTDLRCGDCAVEPRVEAASRDVTGSDWQVSGISRASANIISSVDGGPAYGGTPSDAVILAAITDLKARGIKVTFYPFVLMDIQSDNDLSNPYTGATPQPPYPWRGRITCDPAPGMVGSPDKTGSASTQISAFMGTAAANQFAASGTTVTYSGTVEFSYRRMVLHYAHVCNLAGGVDAFVIGSEMRGLSHVRSSTTGFPFVDALVTLAADVRSVVDGSCKLTYAADWSEYHGYQPADAPGDKLFHLDPLWANSNIDAIGIDNYMPTADWRDGNGHLDASVTKSIYDLTYLRANISGGEGFDWFYASENARNDQVRTPITDGAYAEPWVWRYKDLVNWWSNPHHNRVGGVRDGSPTAWATQSKPFWFTELGCGAVDKGANVPSAFADAKSSEDALPHFSSGMSDEQMQRAFLRAHFRHWIPGQTDFDADKNPSSNVYSGRMVDPDRIYLWTWDARSYPTFPSLGEVWADGRNHATGHWLSGRLGVLAHDEQLALMGSDFGMEWSGVEPGIVVADGVLASRASSLREVSQAMLECADLLVRDTPDGLQAIARGKGEILELAYSDLVETSGGNIEIVRPNVSEATGQLGLSFADRPSAYQSASVTALALDGALHKSINVNLSFKPTSARQAAETLLGTDSEGVERISFSLPPSHIAMEVGDIVQLTDSKSGSFMVTEIRDDLDRKISAVALRAQGIAAQHEAIGAAPAAAGVATKSKPVIYLAHAPADNELGGATRLLAAAYALPWPGYVALLEDGVGTQAVRMGSPARLGVSSTTLTTSTCQTWDRSTTLGVTLYGAHVASASELDVLNGANRLLIQGNDGQWELMGFAGAQLIAESTYTLSNLLRGLNGTQRLNVDAGARIMMVDDAIKAVSWPDSLLGSPYGMTAFAGATDLVGEPQSVPSSLSNASPLAPAHLRSMRDAGGDITLTWVRRGRFNADNWALADIPLTSTPEAYRVTVFDGSSVVRVTETATPQLNYTLAEQTADFGMPPANFVFHISQLSAVYGAGEPALGEFDG